MELYHYTEYDDLDKIDLEFDWSTDRYRHKPNRCFWASHKDAWPRFLRTYSYRDHWSIEYRYRVIPHAHARILTVTPSWHKKIPAKYIQDHWLYPTGFGLDFEAVAEDYDAVNINRRPQHWPKRERTREAFYKWDIPSTVFLRPCFTLELDRTWDATEYAY